MKIRNIFIQCLLFGLFSLHLNAQCSNSGSACGFPCPAGGGCVPGLFCCQSPILCSINDMDGYAGGTPPANAQNISTCFSVENIQYVGFVANGSFLEFVVTPTVCTGGGIEVAIFKGDCDNGASIACQSPGIVQPIQLSLTNLEFGEIYFIAIDGFEGSICGFDIDIISAPPAVVTLDPPTALSGPGVSPPAVICPGSQGTYSTPLVDGATCYNWTLIPPIGTITHPSNLISGPSVNIVWDVPGVAQLCVQAENPCVVPSPSPFCVQITVLPIPMTIVDLPPMCIEDCIDLYGFQACISGFFAVDPIPQSQFGCDSVVFINIPPPISSVYEAPKDTLWCPDDFLLFYGDTIRTAGDYLHIFPNGNFLDCDSTIKLSVYRVTPDINLNSITRFCEGETVTLSVEDIPGYHYQWSPSQAFSCDTCTTTTLRPFPGQRISLTYSGPNCTIETRTKFVAECENTYDTITIGSANIRCLQDPAFPRTDWVDICPEQTNSVRFSPMNDRCISYFGETIGTDTLCVYARGANNALTTYRWYITVAEGNGFLSGRPAPTKELSIYPNPVSEEVYWKSISPLSQIQLFNTQGQLLLDAKVQDTFGQLTVQHLPKGVYHFIGIGQGASLHQMLVIQ